MDVNLNGLHAVLNKLADVPQSEWELFCSLLTYRTISKSSHFVQAGEELDVIGFCLEGLFRLYYTTADGAEYNKSFCGKYEFVTSYSALLQHEAAHFSIQALADSRLALFRYSDFQQLYKRHICWERIGRILAEQLYLQKETREREFLLLGAEQRYRLFLQRYESIADSIPQYHIASYLGITPVALSRIRARLAKN